jgi:hypothetical protein
MEVRPDQHVAWASGRNAVLPVAHQTTRVSWRPQRKARTPHHRQRRWRTRRQERTHTRSGKGERHIIGSACFAAEMWKGRDCARVESGSRSRPGVNALSVNAPSVNDRTLRSQFSSSQFLVLGSQFSVLSSRFLVLGSQFSVLSSRFSVLGSQFSVLGSRFSVLSSPHPATRAAIPPYPSVPVAHRHRHSLLRPRT